MTSFPPATLKIEDLVVKRGGKTVVRGLNLSVEPGQVVGLLGPNGAGKSSAFHAIVGLIRSSAGFIRLGERSLERLAMFQRARLGLGYLPQEASVYEGLSVAENLKAVMEIALPSSERRAQLDWLLEEFDLDVIKDQGAEALSGGQRRRLELARTMATKPSVVLLDEPFAGVDPVAIEGLQSAIRNLSDQGVGVLITDHSARDLLAMVDHALLIDQGQILLEGSPSALAKDETAKKRYLGVSFSLPNDDLG